jgi:hypothetical protein
MPYIICAIKTKARNIPDTVTSGPKMMLIPHIQVLPQIWICSFLQHSHNSCEIQHDHNEGSALFADKKAPHFVTTLEVPICIELGSCHLTPNILRRLPKFLKIFKPQAQASCTLHANVRCKTDEKPGEVLHRRVQMSLMLTQQASEDIRK